MKEKLKGKNNLTFLTIGVLVLIVLVGSVTFAWMANLNQKKYEINVNANTHNVQDRYYMISKNNNLILNTNNDIFGNNTGDITSVTDLEIVTLATFDVNNDKRHYVDLEINLNDFEYSSGTCYDASKFTVDTSKTSKEKCEVTNHHVWAKLKGQEYKCYESTYSLSSSEYDFSAYAESPGGEDVDSCLVHPNALWSKSSIAELYVDLYGDNRMDETTCKTSGVCINTIDRSFLTSYQTEETCVSASNEFLKTEWIENIYDNNICYYLINSVDVTTATINNVIPLYNWIIYGTSGGYVEGSKVETYDYFKTMITLKNFDHDQSINAGKTFNGKVVYKVSDTIPETPTLSGEAGVIAQAPGEYSSTDLNVISEGAYVDNFDRVDGWEVYEKSGNAYLLMTEKVMNSYIGVNIPYGESKAFVARVFKYDSEGQKIYSNFSNEYIVG